MFGQSNRYIAIVINDNIVKAVQATVSGFLEKVGRSVAADTTIDGLAKAIKVATNGFGRNVPLICVIPSSSATANNIEVPSVDPQEIRSIINLQASRHTPYSKEEILISYLNLGLGSQGNTKALLVIAHRSVVKERLMACEKAGFNVHAVAYAPEGMAKAYAKLLNLKKDSAPMGVIDITEHGTNFLVIARGNAVFTRFIPMGISDFSSDPSTHAKFFEESAKSLDACQSEDAAGAPVGSFVVTSTIDAALISGLESVLKVPVRVSAYSAMAKDAGIKKRLEKDFASDSLLEAIGPAIFGAKAEANLMPEEIILKKSVEKQSREGILAGVLALIVMLCAGALMMSKIYFKDLFLQKNLREQYASQKDEVKALQDRMAQTRIVQDYLKGRLLSLDVLNEIYRITPKEVYLNNIAVDEQGMVTIDGIASSMPQVFTYVKTLDDSNLFNNAKRKSSSTKKEGDKDVAAFEITFQLEESGKEKTP